MMDERETLRVLAAAEGNAGAQALALVDLSFARDDDTTRARLRAALEAAAVPHWVTPLVLARLLQTNEGEAAALLARLRPLTIVEPFLARGPDACNVHEETRLALTHRLAETERLAPFAARCVDVFHGDGAHERIERAFHLAIARPTDGADAIDALRDDWSHGGRVEELQAFATMCAELIALPHLAALPRAVAQETLGRGRQNELSVEEVRALATEALTVYQAANDRPRCASAFELLGDVADAMAEGAAARNAYGEALRLRRELAPGPGESPTRETAESMYRLFRAVVDCQKHDLVHDREPQARALHAEAHEIARKLVELDRTNTRFQHALFLSLFYRAEIEVTEGATDAAVRTHVEVLEQARRLVAMSPENATFQRLLYVALFYVANDELEHHRLGTARDLHREGLDIARTLAALNPVSTLAQRDIAVSLFQVACIELAQCRTKEAHDLLRQELDLERRLVALDPANAELTYSMSITLDRLARIAELWGRLDEALSAYGETLDIARRLRALDTSSRTYRRNLSAVLVAHADVLHARDQLDDARAMYEESVTIDRELAVGDAGRAGSRVERWSLALTLNRLARVSVAQRRAAEARPALSEALDLLRQVVAEHEEHVEAHTELACSLELLGEIFHLEGRLQDARQSCEEALATRRAVAARHPDDPELRSGALSTMLALGSIALEVQRLDQARDHFTEALACARQLVALDPMRVAWQEAVYKAQRQLAKIHAALGEPDDARRSRDEALSVIRALRAIDPARKKWQTDLEEIEAEAGS
ncbi:MAG TPA: tetratricopeptide repeat protein [Kofleriaceae bacterium]|nr:tetratricopeptide repeat protein [Kofleriaceae bacterium]